MSKFMRDEEARLRKAEEYPLIPGFREGERVGVTARYKPNQVIHKELFDMAANLVRGIPLTIVVDRSAIQGATHLIAERSTTMLSNSTYAEPTGTIVSE